MNPTFTIFLILFLFISCDKKGTSDDGLENGNKIESPKKNFPYDHPDVIYDIINSSFKELAPKPKLSESTIFLNERLLVADRKLIDQLIEQGGNERLLKIDRKKSVPRAINLKRIENFNSIEILQTYPLTNEDFDKQVGGAIYSRIILNEDSTQASFIYNFARFHGKKSLVLCAIDMALKKGKWIIVSKTCLENSKEMLFEN